MNGLDFFKSRISIIFLCIYFIFPLYLGAEQVVVILGDSLTKGYGLTEEEAYPYLLEQKLKDEGHDIRVINGGISGSTTEGGLDRLKWLMLSKPNIVMIALGANDGLSYQPINFST